ncbi:MAG: hypothetical protein IPO58_24520 [Betaproteobacteria bacterium]|nr:hypothetical protein [Betaproteobacteria bacterium]
MIGACAATWGRPSPAVRPLDAELAELLALLPGRYEGPASGSRLFHKIVPIAAVQLRRRGGVLPPDFARWLRFGHAVPAEDLRLSTAILRAPSNRMRSWVFFPKQGYANLERDARALRTLQPAQLMNFPLECAIRWARGGSPGRFVARVRRQDCTYDSAGFKQKISPDMIYELDRESFALEDILYGESGQPLFPSAGLLRAAREAP